KWTRSVSDHFLDTIPSFCQDPHLFPFGAVATGQHEATDLVGHERLPLGLVVANALVVGEHDPAAPADLRKPDIVMHVLREVVLVSCGVNAKEVECVRKALATGAVEEDRRH